MSDNPRGTLHLRGLAGNQREFAALDTEQLRRMRNRSGSIKRTEHRNGHRTSKAARQASLIFGRDLVEVVDDYDVERSPLLNQGESELVSQGLEHIRGTRRC